MSNLLKQLIEGGFLQEEEIDQTIIYHLTTPCRFNINKDVVKSLKDNYLSNEEIGGVLWAKPTINEEERVYVISKVSYIRNAIEDKPYKDRNGFLRTKQDTYLEDKNDKIKVLNDVFSSGNLPIEFHTHPTKGQNIIESIMNQLNQTETSEQDRKEAKRTREIDGVNLLLPRALVVGNEELIKNLFIGLFDGFIAPIEFEVNKRINEEENMNRILSSISSIRLTQNQKIGLGVGALLLLLFVIKYRKFSGPVILALLASVPLLLSSTVNSEKPYYFNKLTEGDANIYIP